MRLNLTLDDADAAVLNRLADRTHMQAGTLARSMLLTTLHQTVEQEEREQFSADVLQLLDGIDGAFERMELGRRQAAEGNATALDEL